MTVDGPLSWVLQLGFVACGIVLLVFLVLQFRRTGRGGDPGPGPDETGPDRDPGPRTGPDR